MAPSHGVETTASLDHTQGPLECRAVGGFGEQVISRLSHIRSDVHGWPNAGPVRRNARLVVLALWRPDYAYAARIQRQAHVVGATFLPIVFDGRVIRIGPSARPRERGCVTCLRGRLDQHASHEETIRYSNEIVRNQTFGLRGFLPHHVSVAAALASMRIDDVLTHGLSGGVHIIHTVQVDRLDVSEDVLIELPGCPDCIGTADWPRELAAIS